MGLMMESFKNLFSKPATVMYPVEKYEPVPGYRGEYDMKQEDCIYCGLCSRACPAGCISVDKPNMTNRINLTRCISCLACARACPKKCIGFSERYTNVTLGRKFKVYQILEKGKKPPKGVDVIKKTKTEKGVVHVYYMDQETWVGDEWDAEERKSKWKAPK